MFPAPHPRQQRNRSTYEDNTDKLLFCGVRTIQQMPDGHHEARAESVRSLFSPLNSFSIGRVEIHACGLLQLHIEDAQSGRKLLEKNSFYGGDIKFAVRKVFSVK